jgi:K+-transporting ATPase KdpF subunit
MDATILLATSKSAEVNTSTGYVIGAIIALLILGYLLYTLINHEKF